MQFISSYVYWTWEQLINQRLYLDSHLISVDLTTQPLWSFHGLSTADPKSDMRQQWCSHSALVGSWSETLMERVILQSRESKELGSGWNPCLAAKSSLHCTRARSSLSMCNLTLWGHSLYAIWCRSPWCQGKDYKDLREDRLYAILKQGKQT